MASTPIMPRYDRYSVSFSVTRESVFIINSTSRLKTAIRTMTVSPSARGLQAVGCQIDLGQNLRLVQSDDRFFAAIGALNQPFPFFNQRHDAFDLGLCTSDAETFFGAGGRAYQVVIFKLDGCLNQILLRFEQL